MPICAVCNCQEKIVIKLTKIIGLCDGCIQICNDILKEEGIAYEDVRKKPIEAWSKVYATCAGCQKTDLTQERLIAFPPIRGTRYFICNSCVGVLTHSLTHAISGLSSKK